MASRGSVRNCKIHTVFKNVKNFRYQKSRIQSNCFAGFKIDRQTVFFLYSVYNFHKLFNIVIFAGNVMSSAEIQPLYAVQIFSEFFFYCGNSTF